MRVLVVSQYFWPEEFRVNDVAADLVRRGHEVTVLTGWPNYPSGMIYPDFLASPNKFNYYRGATVVRVPILPRGHSGIQLVTNYVSFVLTGMFLAPWRLRGREFDIVFINQLSPITSAVPGLLVGKLRGIPVVLWILDLWPDTLRALGVMRSPLLLKIVGVLVSQIYRRCALILGQSQAFQENVRLFAGDTLRFRYLPAWTESVFEEDATDVDPAPEVQRYMDGAFNVLFAGNLGHSQDFPAILDAADQLRYRHDIRWLVVGDGRAGDWIRKEIVRRKLEASVILLGRHPLNQMPAFFRAASALLVALREDPAFEMTIPGKVQAYMSSGLPIVGMLSGEGARVLRESGAGVVCPPSDARGLARCVEQLADAPVEQRQTMGMFGRQYARREFSREDLLSRLESWLEDLVGTGRY